ncbi:hypothetical protein [Acidovorax sp. Leaf78]|uniref:hypothetical protein n=1 Tax=unclassified Acidovorax TaxID=2684926 RepID=UPI0006F44EF4|nr:hypothetical protein [Acidovorax sp. Leaf78]KQO15846.1 hypothetical protein ASF16_14540 [Acidovorax sp. Leaf78]
MQPLPEGIDPGFEYAPGNARLRSAIPPERPDPIGGGPSSSGSVGLPNRRPSDPLPPPRPLPASVVLPAGMAPQDYVGAFLERFGATLAEPAIVRDVIGERLVVGAQLFQDAQGGWKVLTLGRKATWAEFAQAHPDKIKQQGTSVFDPVLCELVYRWFSAPGHLVLDPFAGGSVRGIVAAATGRAYAGVDLRAEQIEANDAQWAQLGQPGLPAPRWVQGDALAVRRTLPDVQADLLFSCPPYGNLERYSDDKADLSTMRYPRFLRTYRQIIKEAVAMLRQDRFACFVVGDIRDTQGLYRGFVSDTIAAFRDAGARLYNEAILVTQAGSLPIRVGKGFEISRKLGKTHQHVLVFVKGDPQRATAACGAVR